VRGAKIFIGATLSHKKHKETKNEDMIRDRLSLRLFAFYVAINGDRTQGSSCG
jgi:hypothetical protein